MRYSNLRIFFSLLLLLLITTNTLGQTELKSSLQSNLGGSTDPGNVMLTVTAGGQPSPIGAASNSTISLFSGYVYTLIDSINLPPAITHISITSSSANQDIPITATIEDDSGIDNATLHYREGGVTSFTSIAMTSNGDQFQANIPAGSVDNRGVEYFIQATDLDGATSRTPASDPKFFSIPVNLPDPGVARGTAQPSGSAQTSYRLVSIPIAATNSTASAVLEDDLGQYDDTQWRFFELRADQTYGEFNNTIRMAPGKSFWLIVRDAGKIIDIGAGTTNKTSEDFSISLNAGFTFVANPFNFNVPLSNVNMENGDALDIRSFNGTQFVTFSGSVQPFDGYLIASNEVTRLLIDPILTPVTNALAKKSDTPQLSNQKWNIHIFAYAQQAKDTLTVAAVNSSASNDWDIYDLPEAPVIGEYVSVYFPHPEWGKVFKSYTVDARPEPLNGEVWEFIVRSNISDEIRLSFMGLEDVPPEFEIRLLDDNLNISTNLRQDNTYSIAGTGEDFRKNLKLVVGKSDFFEDDYTDNFSPPTSFELAQNFPNPFNPATNIRYSLPVESNITLKIYNIKGAEIATLVDNELQKPGHHLTVWNGTDSQGKLVASGIYVYQLSAGSLKITKKMAFLK